jgi:hypothetical protein
MLKKERGDLVEISPQAVSLVNEGSRNVDREA